MQRQPERDGNSDETGMVSSMPDQIRLQTHSKTAKAASPSIDSAVSSREDACHDAMGDGSRPLHMLNWQKMVSFSVYCAELCDDSIET